MQGTDAPTDVLHHVTVRFFNELQGVEGGALPRPELLPVHVQPWHAMLPWVRTFCQNALPYQYMRDHEAFYVVLWVHEDHAFILEWAKRLQALLKDSKYHMLVLGREPLRGFEELDLRYHNVHLYAGEPTEHTISVWLRTMLSCDLLVADEHPFGWIPAAWNVHGLTVGRNLPLVLRALDERVMDVLIVEANRGGDTLDNRLQEHVLRYLQQQGKLATVARG
jgi:hypothetical protein